MLHRYRIVLLKFDEKEIEGYNIDEIEDSLYSLLQRVLYWNFGDDAYKEFTDEYYPCTEIGNQYMIQKFEKLIYPWKLEKIIEDGKIIVK